MAVGLKYFYDADGTIIAMQATGEGTGKPNMKYVTAFEDVLDENGKLVDRKPVIKLINIDTSYWFTQSTNDIYVSLMEKSPSEELVRQIDNMVEKYGVDTWYFIYAVQDDLTFFLNNYVPHVDRLNQTSIYSLKKFMEFTKDLTGAEKKEAFLTFMEHGGDIDKVRGSITRKEGFDKKLLDFLEGKITIKTVDWGVGQVMKAHPKRFNPKEIKQALMERFVL